MLLQMEIDEPFLPNVQVTLTFSDDNQYFASKITRSIIVTDEHRTAHLDVEWKPTEVRSATDWYIRSLTHKTLARASAGGCCAQG